MFPKTIVIQITLLGLLSLSYGCTKEKITQVQPKYSGDHTTAQIRGMWHVCYQTRVRNMPHLPHIIHWEHCDCLIDKSRENFSSKDYDQMGTDNLTIFFKKTSLICDQNSIAAPEPASV